MNTNTGIDTAIHDLTVTHTELQDLRRDSEWELMQLENSLISSNDDLIRMAILRTNVHLLKTAQQGIKIALMSVRAVTDINH